MMTKRKMLVIGLDGATFDLLGPWTKRGKLPTLRRLIEGGISGELRSTIPPITAPAWTSLVTGKNPGKHGIFDFSKREANSYESNLLSSIDRDSEAIWNILTRARKKVIVINVPFTYPPEKVNGIMISGIPAPESGSAFVYPEGLLKEIQREVGHYRIWYKVEPREESVDSFLSDVEQLVEMRGQTARYLMKEKQWDFFMVNFQVTDWVQHFFWKYMDDNDPKQELNQKSNCRYAIENTYASVDMQIAEMLELVDKNTYVFVLSDHGAGPLNKNLYFNNWLMETGLLHYRMSLKYLMFRLGLTSENLYKILAKLHLANLVPRFREKKKFIAKCFLTLSDIDWSRTRAYSFGIDGNVFINLKGREPQGTVPRAKYEEVRHGIIEKLHEFRDPETGELVFDEIFLREELFEGPHLGEAPDILLLLTRYHQDFKFVSRSLIGPPPDNISCNHRMNGIMIINGPDIRKGKTIDSASILDIAPTILRIMNVPIPRDMDGRVLVDAFRDGASASFRKMDREEQIRGKEAFTDEDEKRIRGRLKELGYL